MPKTYNNFKLKKDLTRYYNSLKNLKKYNIGNKVVCDIGEYFAKEVLGIRLHSNKSNPYADGLDKEGKNVQIKTRYVLKDGSKAAVFRPFNKKKLRNIDYALLIRLDKNFWLDEIWKVERKTLKKYLEYNKSNSFALTSGKRNMKGVSQLY